ncbi:phenylalanyl-tRNA synthetase [Pseudovirgaria hyperparasitica]|uniref:Phenylalanine--tRNA ligase, mitochondrial n=1 Tax=Pseudovirgaria hyperparasitica TaxID=470096 RepID=A0A6A6WJQ7_9PEZI|nr:phenylalanyl-tRNA synthetase [Pseudovirgaria hyperparasitica]KAF2762077.1 phenylalanyl-tRNA synthetase [Pseudovirgaria hyperparasitica]
MRSRVRPNVLLRSVERAVTHVKPASYPWICSQCRYSSSASTSITIGGRTEQTDNWTNVTPSILSSISRRLHLQPDHPLAITRTLIESRFPGYKYHNNLSPIVTTAQNFDSLGFPGDHPGRAKSDTYYINKDTVLRTHTSAHQLDTFRANQSDGYLIAADVYRRDAVDRSHYPVFHQMEGAMTWDRNSLPSGTTLEQHIWGEVDKIPRHDVKVEDPNPSFHDGNPLQADYHSEGECKAMATHLKRSLEDVVVTIFNAARDAAVRSGDKVAIRESQEPLKIRWVEAYFPFTSPSWELEVFWQGDWLEVLGSGIVKQSILNDAGVPSRHGWAFGLGLERIAMLLFSIPDIRLFWSADNRFLSQFSAEKKGFTRFVPFSKYPECPKDVAFWLPTPQTPSSQQAAHETSKPTATSSASSAGGAEATGSSANADATPALFQENDLMEIVRNEAGADVEDVRLTDSFTHPKTGRQSRCYRIVYRSLERTLTNVEANRMHEGIKTKLVEKLGVEIR